MTNYYNGRLVSANSSSGFGGLMTLDDNTQYAIFTATTAVVAGGITRAVGKSWKTAAIVGGGAAGVYLVGVWVYERARAQQRAREAALAAGGASP